MSTNPSISSELILHKSGELTPNDFCDWALSWLSSAMDVHSAIWAIRTPSGDGEFLSSIGIDAMEFLQSYKHIAHQDPIPELMAKNSGTAVTVNLAALPEITHSDIRKWAKRFGLEKMLAIEISRDISKTQQGIILFRRNGSRDYNAKEKVLFEKWAPLIFKGLQHGREADIKKKLFDEWSGNNYVCTVTQSGTILDMEDRFQRQLEVIWPNWIGPYLPDEVHKLLADVDENSTLRKECVLIRTTPFGNYKLVVLTSLGVLGNLTKREYEVAELYASGLSTDRIVKLLGITTYTVENHRKNIYRKLGINSNHQLVKCFEPIRKALKSPD